MFGKYLKVVHACDRCGEELHHQRADDFPPYIVISIVGHLLLSLALTLAAFTLALKHVPLEQLGMSSSFDAMTALAAFGILNPMLAAAAMSLSVPAVKSLLFRARDHLREAIAPYMQEDHR